MATLRRSNPAEELSPLIGVIGFRRAGRPQRGNGVIVAGFYSSGRSSAVASAVATTETYGGG